MQGAPQRHTLGGVGVDRRVQRVELHGMPPWGADGWTSAREKAA